MEETRSRASSVAATLILILVLAVLFAFSLKVFSYYRQIRSGEIDVANLKFNSTKVDQMKLAALAAGAPGSGKLATEDDPSLGNPDAPITIVEFGDFGCPYTEEETYVVKALMKEYPDDIRFIYRDFPLAELHPGADVAALGGECANDQGKFWEYYDVVFAHQAEYTSDLLISYADEAGLNLPAFTTCLESGVYREEVQNDLADGVAAGVRGTPTFFANGVKIEGNIPYGTFNDVIKAFLEK